MKNLIITIAIICAAVIAAVAQPRAIGVRAGYNFEVSYQHSTGTGMIEVDAGFSPFLYQNIVHYSEPGTPTNQTYRYGRAQAVIFYDFILNPVTNFNLYLGAGVGVSWGYGELFEVPHYSHTGTLINYRRLGLPLGLQAGLEYEIPSIPLNLSLDWRPMVNLFGIYQENLSTYLLNIAAGIRYRF